MTMRSRIDLITIASVALIWLLIDMRLVSETNWYSCSDAVSSQRPAADDNVSIRQTWTLEQAPLEHQQGRQSDRAGKFAYLYAIGGCTETSCLAYVLNVVVAAHLFQRYNSTADIILLVRISSFVNSTTLAPKLERYLEKAGVTFQYLPKVEIDNFATSTIEKFRVLELLEYDRVIFLDGDIVPRCNLDFFFEESYLPGGMLSGTVGQAGNVAPITASFFIVTPKKGEFARLTEWAKLIIRQSNGEFDREYGWGHRFTTDSWRSEWPLWKRDHYRWVFKGSEIDQGLILMYFKYMVMDYSQIVAGTLETWRDVTGQESYWQAKNITVHHIKETNKYIARVNHTRGKLIGCRGTVYGMGTEYFHYAGGSKPWNIQKGNNVLNVSQHIPKTEDTSSKPQQFWLYHLAKANKTFSLGLPSQIKFNRGNPLGSGGRGFEIDLFSEYRNVDKVIPVPALENVSFIRESTKAEKKRF